MRTPRVAQTRSKLFQKPPNLGRLDPSPSRRGRRMPFYDDMGIFAATARSHPFGHKSPSAPPKAITNGRYIHNNDRETASATH